MHASMGNQAGLVRLNAGNKQRAVPKTKPQSDERDGNGKPFEYSAHAVFYDGLTRTNNRETDIRSPAANAALRPAMCEFT